MHIFTIFVLIWISFRISRSVLQIQKNRDQKISKMKDESLDYKLISIAKLCSYVFQLLFFIFIGYIALTINNSLGVLLVICVFVIELVQFGIDQSVWNKYFVEKGTADDIKKYFRMSNKSSRRPLYVLSNIVELVIFVYFIVIYIMQGMR